MSLAVDHHDFRLYIGNVEEELRLMEPCSVHCVVTSPPYYGLRDYGTGEWVGGDADCEHDRGGRRQVPQTKHQVVGDAIVGAGSHRGAGRVCVRCAAELVDEQVGLEETLTDYIARMVGIFREVRRVLRDDGTVWLNLGDSFNAYNGNRGLSGSTLEGRRQHLVDRPKLETGAGLTVPELKPKDKMLVPHRVAIALQDDGWWVRQDNVWWKPNTMPESAEDRTTNAHEYVFHLSKRAIYYYDGDAIKEEASWDRWGAQTTTKYTSKDSGSKAEMVMRRSKKEIGDAFDTSKKNARSVWVINTVPFPDAHFAVFPPELPTRCIMAGTSEKGCCPSCGAPWKRISKTEIADGSRERQTINEPSVTQEGQGRNARGSKTWGHRLTSETLGWEPTCGCDAGEPVPCTVLDIFAGSGTTPRVARALGRRSVAIELSPKYAEMIKVEMAQLGLFT